MQLVDILKKYQGAPGAFYLLPDEVLKNLGPGDLVKLVVEGDRGAVGKNMPPSGERIWVRIEMRINDSFVGKLECQPAKTKACFGDTVEFDLRHVLEYHDQRR